MNKNVTITLLSCLLAALPWASSPARQRRIQQRQEQLAQEAEETTRQQQQAEEAERIKREAREEVLNRKESALKKIMRKLKAQIKQINAYMMKKTERARRSTTGQIAVFIALRPYREQIEEIEKKIEKIKDTLAEIKKIKKALGI